MTGQYILKWTTVATGAFGFSAIPRSYAEAMALARRMEDLTSVVTGTFVDPETGDTLLKKRYLGRYELMEVRA